MGHCEHALRVKGTTPRNGSGGPWEIAVVKDKSGDGSFNLYYDTYGGAGQALTAKVGPDANRLRQEYAIASATRQAAKTLKGFKATRETLPTGAVRLNWRKR